jgi:hypothetical protein
MMVIALTATVVIMLEPIAKNGVITHLPNILSRFSDGDLSFMYLPHIKFLIIKLVHALLLFI